jgi:Chemotaxis signal transduction protein
LHMYSFITFNINDQTYGMDMLGVEKIIKLSKISSVPNSCNYIEGLLDVQDELIPAINLKKLLNFSKDELLTESNVIIVFNQDEKCGIIVDSVNDIFEVNENVIKKIKNNRFIYGVVKVNDTIINLLNYAALILH